MIESNDPNLIQPLRPLNLTHKNDIMEIIYSCQEQLQVAAALYWLPPMIEEILMSETSFGIFDLSTDKLTSFLIFRNMETIAEVYVLATHPKFQQKGLMSKMIFYLKENFNEVWLEVHKLNKLAIHFYLKQGFIQTGLRKRYYHDGADAILLTWRRELAIT